MEKDWWQITDFADEISRTLQEKFDDPKAGIHYNTVDKWFKALETKRIHYVNRAAGEKVYDKQDLYIGCFIAEARRDNRYRLDVIYENIPKQMDVRPFPPDFRDESPVTIDETLMQNRILEGLNKSLATQFNIYEEKLQLQINRMIAEGLQESVKNLLPPPVDPEKERAKRMDDNLTRMKLEWKCEEEAILEWNKLPESERTKKAGLFRKEEDLLKRDNFIRAYKKQHMHRLFEESYTL